MLRRRKRGGAPKEAPDHLVDSRSWNAAINAVLAARSGNEIEFILGTVSAPEKVPENYTFHLYLRFLLSVKISLYFGRMPNKTDLSQLARELLPKIEQLVPITLSSIYVTFLHTFGLQKKGDVVEPSINMLVTVASLSYLIDGDVQEWFAFMKPQMARWCKHNADWLDELNRDEQRR